MKTYLDFGITGIEGKSGEATTTCPECSAGRKKKNDKCLSVNLDKETWFCHHCQFTGGLGNKQEAIGRHYKRPVTPVKKPAVEKGETLSDKSRRYLHGRGISDTVLSRNKITDGPEWMPQTQKEENCIKFPFFRDGEIINYKFRDGNKNFKMVKDAERILYGFDDIKTGESSALIFVEGEIDKLSFEVSGTTTCVSVPNGAADKLEFLEKYQHILERIENYYIAVDNDEAGKKLEGELIRRLGPAKCKVVEWLEGCKDANDTLVKHGAEALRECIEKARPVPIAGIYEVRDFAENLITYFEKGDVRGVPTGWHKVNNFYSVRPGEWTLITGIPSHGKSEFLDALLVNLAFEEEWNFGVCSPENQPLERHAAKLIEKYSGFPMSGPKVERIQYPDLIKSMTWLEDHFSFILPEEDNLTVEGVLELAKALVFRKGIKGLVIDPWNELDHSRHHSQSETEYISNALTKIRRFAREYQVHVFLVAHPTKLQKKSNGSYGVPRPYDVSGSSHWYNKADNCIAIWRDTKEGCPETEVHVQKVRFKGVGKPGLARLHYDIVTGRYSDN